MSRSLTERARKAAFAANLGAWERSLLVNGRIDKSHLMNGIALVFLVPWIFIAMGIFLPEGWSWWLRPLNIISGLIFLSIGIIFFQDAWRRWRAGEALIHLFDRGVVLERKKGEIFALPYADTPADYVVWKETLEHGERTRHHLWITLPDSRTVMLDGWWKEENQQLASVAARWGLSPTSGFSKKRPWAHPLW